MEAEIVPELKINQKPKLRIRTRKHIVNHIRIGRRFQHYRIRLHQSNSASKSIPQRENIYPWEKIYVNPGKIILSNVNHQNSVSKKHPNLLKFRNRLKID